MVPSLAAFRAALPELDYVDDSFVIGALAGADVWMQESLWDTRDYPLAAIYLAAHFAVLATDASTSGSAVQDTEDPTTFIRSIGFGERRVMYGQRAGSSLIAAGSPKGEDTLDQTRYGQLFLQLRGRNIIPIMVV